MSTEESKKVDKEVSLTRRAALKAGWAVPIVLAVTLGTGNVFVHASPQNNSNSDFGIGGGASEGFTPPGPPF